MDGRLLDGAVSLLNVTCYTVVTSRKVQALFGNYIFVPELVS